MKKTISFIVIIACFLSANAQNYFSATAPSGHILYYDTVYNGSELQANIVRNYGSPYGSYSGTLIIPDSIPHNGTNIPVVAIADHTFQYCDSLDALLIGNMVTTIGNYSFYGCSGLVSITWGDNVSFIGSSAFTNCSSLTSIVIPNSIDTVRDNTFYMCNNLQTVIVGDGVLHIGQNAFTGESLKTVDIGSGITTMVSGSIQSGWGNTCDVYIRSAMAPTLLSTYRYDILGENAVINNLKIHVPCASLYSYMYAYPWYYYYNNSRIIPIPNHSYEFFSNDTSMGTIDIIYVSCPHNIGVSAIAKPGFECIGWSDGYPNSGREVYLDRDTSITAYFDTISYVITGWSSNNTYGIVTGSDTVYAGHSVTLTATPNRGYRFWQWSDGSVENPHTIIATEDMLLIAYFNLGPEQYYLTVTSSDSTQGMVSGSGEFDYLTDCTISAIPNYGYHFSRWNDGNTTNPRVVSLTQDTAFTAFFEINNYQLTVQPNNNTLGYVHGSGVYPYGTMVTVAASPVQGNRFDHWSNDTTLPIYSFSLTSDIQLTAVFMPADTLFVHDTTYISIPVHDTTYIDVFLHDTTTIIDTMTLTEYVPIHDTTYIMLTDTVTNTIYDTVTNTVYDTVTNIVFDTVTNTIYDTTVIYSTDTLWLFDTVFVHDTIYIYDTVYVGVDEVETISANIYTSGGQIVVDCAEGNTVWLYDINGRVLATKRDEYMPLHFDAPYSGTYMIKIGNYPARKVVVIR